MFSLSQPPYLLAFVTVNTVTSSLDELAMHIATNVSNCSWLVCVCRYILVCHLRRRMCLLVQARMALVYTDICLFAQRGMSLGVHLYVFWFWLVGMFGLDACAFLAQTVMCQCSRICYWCRLVYSCWYKVVCRLCKLLCGALYTLVFICWYRLECYWYRLVWVFLCRGACVIGVDWHVLLCTGVCPLVQTGVYNWCRRLYLLVQTGKSLVQTSLRLSMQSGFSPLRCCFFTQSRLILPICLILSMQPLKYLIF